MNETFYRKQDYADGYVAELTDDSILSEPETPWSSISEQVAVIWGGRTKIALVCVKPVRKITIHQSGLETSIEVNDGEQVYQAIKSCAKWNADGTTTNEIIGRIIGKVKNGIVIEEKFIDANQKTISGLKF